MSPAARIGAVAKGSEPKRLSAVQSDAPKSQTGPEAKTAEEPIAMSGAEEIAPQESTSPADATPESGSSAGSASGSPEPVKSAYPAPASLPTQPGPKGIRFDFNDGCRITVEEGEHPYRIRMTDLDTGNILYSTTLKTGRVNSTKRFYVRFGIEIWQDEQQVFAHQYSARDRDVLIVFPEGTLGDTLGWFPYTEKFLEKHGCRLTCAMSERLIPLFRDVYRDIEFCTLKEIRSERYYATYSMGLFFDDKEGIRQPCDFRMVGLHRTAGYILGVDPREMPPRLAIPNDTRPIPEPYVCIAVQSTTQAKHWNNPHGWFEIVAFLKQHGYRVICIDQQRVHGAGLIWNHIPHGVEDMTGMSLTECARWLKHADFFIGLSSGLSWLAWGAGTPVVLISGFSHPLTEFETPYRVINWHACNSCWNDQHYRFDHKDFLWCPRHKETPRQFECTRVITAEHVKSVIRRIPGFGSRPELRKPSDTAKTSVK